MKKVLWLLPAAMLAVGAATLWQGSSVASVAPNSNFVLLDASKTTTADFKGKVTLVNFWATSCITCVAEMPKMITTYNRYHAKGYEMLALAIA